MGMKITEDEKKEIGGNIKKFREEKNMSQARLASLLWIDRTSLSKYEIGMRTPDIFTLCRMADVFGVSLDVLVGRSWNQERKESK